MLLGSFKIEQLSEGQFEFFSDGIIHRKPVDSADAVSSPLIGKQNAGRNTGINPIYVNFEDYHILLDTGLGWGLDSGSAYQKVSNVVTNLDIFGIKPSQITHVILTHLHYDHAAGSTFTGPDAATHPTFANARYFVQRQEWNFALSQLEAGHAKRDSMYKLDELYRLVADKRITFIEEDFYEPLKGIQLIRTGGHTPGHQIVKLSSGKDTAYYLGDLLPNKHHLNRYAMAKSDTDPLQAKKMKIQLLKTACQQNACLLFYHSLYSAIGRLHRDPQKKYIVNEIR